MIHRQGCRRIVALASVGMFALMGNAGAAQASGKTGASTKEVPSREAETLVGGSLRNFEGKTPHTLRRHSLVQYDLQLKNELFFVHVPEGYRGNEPFGVLAFVAPGDAAVLPEGWESVLKERRLIYLAPQKAGNTHPVSRRAGLTMGRN